MNQATHTKFVEDKFTTELHPGSIKSAMRTVGAGSRDLWQVKPENLRVIEGFNVRVRTPTYIERVRSLADSMKSEGYYQDQPMAGYVAKENEEMVIYITGGHRRREAVLLAIAEGAEIVTVPVVVSQVGVSMEDLTVALVRGNDGRPLTPYETAVVCKRLIRYGLDVDVIANRLGFSKQYVDNLLSLMASPVALRDMVINDLVSASMAIEMLAKHGEKAVEKLNEALAQANASGKDRVTKKYVTPVAVISFKKAVKQSAEGMYATISEIKADPGFIGLSEGIREKLDVLLKTLNEAHEDELKAAVAEAKSEKDEKLAKNLTQKLLEM